MSFSSRTAAVGAVYLGTFMATLAISIVTVALPAIQAGLHTDLAGIQWVVGSYALCLSAFMLSAGPIGDRYGRKRAWLFGVALFLVGSTICALTSSLAVLIAGCAIQGVAGALVIPGALSILTQAFPDPGERAHAIGGWSSFSGVSLIVGPMLGGILVDGFGWPSIFLINLPVGIGALILGAVGIQESADPDHASFDPAGQILSIVALGALTYALVGSGRNSLGDPSVIGAFVVAVATAIVFIAVEKRVARPVLPVDLFRNPVFATVNCASYVLGFAGYTSLFLFSLFLQQAQGWSATQAGWRMAPVFAAMAIVASQFGRLLRRFGQHGVIIAGYVLLGLSMLAMATFSPGTPYWLVAPLFALLGIGMGLAVPSTGAAAMHAAPRERTGAASATMNAMRQSGMTIGIALLGATMTTGAVDHMAARLGAAGFADPAKTAANAVRQRALPVELDMPLNAFSGMLKEAIAHGFADAAAIAGVCSLAMALVLILALRVRPATTGRFRRTSDNPFEGVYAMKFFREIEPDIHMASGRLETEQDGRDWTGEYDQLLARGRPVAVIAHSDDRPLQPAGKPMVLWMKARKTELGQLVRVMLYIVEDEAERQEMQKSLPGRAKAVPYPMALAADEGEAVEKARATLR